jgi:hypothetical protein
VTKQAIYLPELHPAQQALHDDKHRFRVAVCGRRWGKSINGLIECIEVGAQGGTAWWIAPSYSQSVLMWMDIKHLAQQIPGATIREADRIIRFKGNGVIMLKSADSPDALRGAGLDLAVLDETPLMQQTVWQGSIRAALSDRRGRALFLFTPKGIGNWTYKLYGFGLDDTRPDWSSHHYPTASNPYIPADEIEAARQDLPERVFQEEYLAEFITDGGGVFRGVLAACTATKQDGPIAGHSYVFGIDWARFEDYTVVSVFDMTARREVFLDRFNKIEFAYQRDRIKLLNEKWQPYTIWAEANNMGLPNIEALRNDGLPIHPFDTTNASKEELINGLALAIERTSQGLPSGAVLLDDPTGIAELQAYEFDRLPSGRFRFGARGGAHDDTVIARSLAVKYGMQGRMMPPIAFDWDGTIDKDSAADLERWRQGRL